MNVATATVTILQGGDVARLEVPAFTRTALDLTELVSSYLAQYVQEFNPQGMSLADFSFWLLAKSARHDPRTIDVGTGGDGA